MPKTIVYGGKTCSVLEEQKATRSDNPLVKKAYLTKEFGWLVDQDCEKVNAGQNDTQTSGQ